MDALRGLFSRRSPDADAVDLPGSSLLALQRKRAINGAELRLHLYVHADRSFIITSVMSVPGSAIVEIGDPSVLPIDVADADLGRAVCDHLLRHEAREPGNLRDRKVTDWAAFKASGERSVDGFESKSWRVSIETVHQALAIEAAPLRTLHPELSVKAYAPPVHEELGATVRRALTAAAALRTAGLV